MHTITVSAFSASRLYIIHSPSAILSFNAHDARYENVSASQAEATPRFIRVVISDVNGRPLDEMVIETPGRAGSFTLGRRQLPAVVRLQIIWRVGRVRRATY